LKADEIDLYNVNIPLVEGLLTDEGLKIMWTSMWRNSYGRLFKAVPPATPASVQPSASAAGPNALVPSDSSIAESSTSSGALAFKFSPAMEGLIHPDESRLPIGSDGWAMFKGATDLECYLVDLG
jgi:tubulin--tyrosine ligase